MKPTLLKLTSASIACSALAWTAISLSAKPADDGPSDTVAQMDRDQANVSSRLKMSAPMELYLINGKDPVVEAMEMGAIIEVSLEKVEADLAAAAATPDLQDDIRASEQAHRASCRFFSGAPAQGGRSK